LKIIVLTKKGAHMKKTIILTMTLIYSFSIFAQTKLSDEQANALIQKSLCFACHSVTEDKLGPSYMNVAKRYAHPKKLTYLKSQTPAEYLFHKVRTGSNPQNKNWLKTEQGTDFSIMTPNAIESISDEDLKLLIGWILDLKK
jgi:cytochrome c551/c552